MPIPIKPTICVDEDSNFLNELLMAPSLPSKSVIASNKDAALLYSLWDGKGKLGAKDIQRLKNMGFISEQSGNIVYTKKAEKVITTMLLGEENKFQKTQKNKSYMEILASMSKKGKKGYRMASDLFVVGHVADWMNKYKKLYADAEALSGAAQSNFGIKDSPAWISELANKCFEESTNSP